jgi:hypothetical protein
MTARSIDTVRLDVLPLVTATAYMFVTPDQAKFGPWWHRLYDYLTSLAPKDLGWAFEPIQGIYVARPMLHDEERDGIVAFLRTAPAKEIEERRTLKRALSLTAEQQANLALVYF